MKDTHKLINSGSNVMHRSSGAENDSVRNAWLGRQFSDPRLAPRKILLWRDSHSQLPKAVRFHEEDCKTYNVSANIRASEHLIISFRN